MSTAPDARAQKHAFAALTALCTLAYFVSYLSRINLSAAMVEIVASGFAEKTTVALALSVNSVTYGAGQIISGYLGDRYRPQNVMLCGFLLAGTMNLGVALLPDQRLLILLWAINGFAQSLMWPPMVRILAQRLNSDQYSVACKWVSWGSAFGTMAVYGLTPLIIGISGYRMVFFLTGGVALCMAAVWKLGYEHGLSGLPTCVARSAPAQKSVQPAPATGLSITVLTLMVPVMLSIVMQGALRDGVTNWLPTLVSESFGLASSAAILSGVLLPIFHILCLQIVSQLYRRVLRNELFCCGVIFVAATGVAILLALLHGSGVLSTVVLCALLVGCMHGVNFLFTGMVPPYFARYGHVSLVSGVLNSSTYVGSALSTYGIAVFSQACGWTATIWLWAAIAGTGMVICLSLSRKWAAFTE